MKEKFVFESDAVYHGKSKSGQFMSSHLLKMFKDCPFEYSMTVTGSAPEKDTPAFRFGRAAHKYILEGREAFDAEYAVFDGDRRTKKYKEFKEKYADCEILTVSEFADLETMKLGVDYVQPAKEILSEGFAEGVLRADLHGVPCQIKIDWVNEHQNMIVDLKTCDTLTWFEHDFKRFSYQHQLAFYRDVFAEVFGNQPKVTVIAVEKRFPYRAGVWAVTPLTLNVASEENKQALSFYLECKSAGQWPTGYERIKTMEVV